MTDHASRGHCLQNSATLCRPDRIGGCKCPCERCRSAETISWLERETCNELTRRHTILMASLRSEQRLVGLLVRTLKYLPPDLLDEVSVALSERTMELSQ